MNSPENGRVLKTKDSMSEPKDEAIRIFGLSKRYGGTIALDGVNLHVRKGDIYGFLGRNGAGKSTTIKILAGLVKPNEGSISILGKPRTPFDHRVRRKAGFLIENPSFHSRMNAVENLRCHQYLQGRGGKEHLQEIMDLIEKVGLKNAARRRVGGYSTGMRQRLGIAQALLGDPELVVLDEPLNGLDPEGILHIRELIKDDAARRGTTYFVSSHILAEVEQLCTRVGIVDSGRTVKEGNLEELGATGWIRLKVSDPERARTAILAHWSGIEPASAADGVLDLRMESSAVPELVRLIVKEGLDLYSVSERPRSLEDIFMELTRREK